MDPANDLIFVSIASYRDAQLTPTVNDCIAKAAYPERLRFGVCWQHGPEESAPPSSSDPHVRILDVDWRDSRGACWARAMIMKLWLYEHWFLQIDAHSRFASNWDARLILAANSTGSSKPLLSTYPCAFTPATMPGVREVLTGVPQQIVMQSFSGDGIPELRSQAMPAQQAPTRPTPARFLAAGFIFAPGSFVEDVPYDQDLYFHGEEIAMAVRAFTSGYDLFHPAETLLWHDYERHYAARHWEDHVPENHVRRPWGGLDLKSKQKIRGLLSGETIKPFGLGNARTLTEFEAYAGVSFRLRKVQDYTRLALVPPNPPLPAEWPDHIHTWLVRVVFSPARLPSGAFETPRNWQVALKDDQGREIYRRGFPEMELIDITGREPSVALICELHSGIVPASWSIDPISRTRGWLPKLEGPLNEQDYSIIVTDENAPEEDPLSTPQPVTPPEPFATQEQAGP